MANSKYSTFDIDIAVGNHRFSEIAFLYEELDGLDIRRLYAHGTVERCFGESGNIQLMIDCMQLNEDKQMIVSGLAVLEKIYSVNIYNDSIEEFFCSDCVKNVHPSRNHNGYIREWGLFQYYEAIHRRLGPVYCADCVRIIFDASPKS